MQTLRILIWFTVLGFSQQLMALSLERVSHDHYYIEPTKGSTVNVRFSLTQAAYVTLSWYDGRDWLIRRINSGQILPAGEHHLNWDGRDQQGRVVPAEAYRYTLRAYSEAGDSVEYDVSEYSGGKKLHASNVKWDPQTKKITYVLPTMSRVNVRIGLGNSGPLMTTLLNWVPRLSGRHTFFWDGKDREKVIELGRHPRRDILVQAFSLSDNTVLVGPEQQQSQLIRNIRWIKEKRKPKRTFKKNMFDHSQQAMTQRGDFPVLLVLPDKLRKTKDNIPVVSQRTPMRIDLEKKYWQQVLDQRIEIVLYLDGQYIEESEAGTLPQTWFLDLEGINPGVHYVTVNLRGYEGNFGARTIKVYVEAQKMSHHR